MPESKNLRGIKKFSIKALRQAVGQDQVDLIDKILKHKAEKNAWMPSLRLYMEIPKTTVLEIVEPLCSSIITERDPGQNKLEFQVGLLGYFVSSKGLEYKDLITKYLKFVAKLIRQDASIEKIKSSAFCSEHKVNIDKSQELYELLQLCSFGGGWSSSGWGIWEMGIPVAAEDIEDDPEAYLQRRLKDFFYPDIPVTLQQQREAESKKKPQSFPYSRNTAFGVSEVSYSYVNEDRLMELRQLQSVSYDFKRLIKLCEELNDGFSRGNYFSCAFLLRAILDHVPPIFGGKNFSFVESNYAGSRSFKKTMIALNSLSRNISDDHIHGQIKKSESLPTAQQINFAHALDTLLAEIVRISDVKHQK